MPAWVGSKDVLVHIGVHKSGSTAIQSALVAAKAEMARRGITYPGRNALHWHATLALTNRKTGWGGTDQRADLAKWDRLRGMIASAPGAAILSSEALCEAREEAIDHLIEDLAPRRVRMVVCLRPLSKLLSSNWQQYVKTGLQVPYDTWLRSILLDEGKPATPSFWRRNDHASLIRRWADKVGMDNITVVVVDSSDPTGLFRSFEDLLGLDRGVLSPDPAAPRNRSLSWPEVEAVRTLNADLVSVVDFEAYHRYLRRGGIHDLVETRSARADSPIVTPDWAVERANEIGGRHARDIMEMGATVIGNLGLLSTGELSGQQDVNPPVDSIPLDIATTLVSGTLRAIDRDRKAAARAEAATTPA